jgi:hypothetical protein
MGLRGSVNTKEKLKPQENWPIVEEKTYVVNALAGLHLANTRISCDKYYKSRSLQALCWSQGKLCEISQSGL